jgi:SAM-dependent methyltransferase
MTTKLRNSQEPSGADANYTVWKSWDSTQFGHISRLDQAYFDAEFRFVPQRAKVSVLEIGFGHGAFMSYARTKRQWQITGIEINNIEMEAAASADYRVVRSIDDLPSAECFDLIVAFDVFEHLEVEVLSALLVKIARRLAPRGYLLARFPNGDSPFGLSNQHGDHTHKTVITRSKLTQLALPAGLVIETYRGEKAPVLCGQPMFMLQRCIANPVRAFLDVVIAALFLPTKRIPYSAQNAVAVLSRPND